MSRRQAKRDPAELGPMLLERARLRQLRAEAALAELQLRQRRGELLEVEAVDRAIKRAVARSQKAAAAEIDKLMRRR